MMQEVAVIRGILAENVRIIESGDEGSALFMFVFKAKDTPGIVYRTAFVVRSKNKACDEKEGKFYGKTKNQN